MQLQISRTGEKKLVPASKKVSFAASKAERTSPPLSIQTAIAEESQRNMDLDAKMREKIERRFGLDFSGVRLVESDLPAKLGANAVTQGDLIRFAPGAFRPDTAKGERLLSHELSHVVQQSRGDAIDGAAGLPLYDPGTEHGADVMADRAIRGDLTSGTVRSFTPASSGQTPMLGDKLGLCCCCQADDTPPRTQNQVPSEEDEDEDAPLDSTVVNYMERRYGSNVCDIYTANNVQNAQNAFISITGHDSSTFTKNIGGKNRDKRLNLRCVVENLCAMALVINDITALRGVLSGFDGVPEKSGTTAAMETIPYIRLSNPNNSSIVVRWNSNKTNDYLTDATKIGNAAYMVGSTPNDDNRRRAVDDQRNLNPNNFAASSEFYGAHEMGHVAACHIANLVVSKKLNEQTDPNSRRNVRINSYILKKLGLVENFIIQDAIAELYNDTHNQELGSFILNNQPANSVDRTTDNADQTALNEAQSVKDMAKNLDFVYADPAVYARFITTMNNIAQEDHRVMDFKTYLEGMNDNNIIMLNFLSGKNLTSLYGAKNHKEVIGEAFADVYQNGDSAKAFSKKIVDIIKRYLDDSLDEGWKEDLFKRSEDWINNAREKSSRPMTTWERVKHFFTTKYVYPDD